MLKSIREIPKFIKVKYVYEKNYNKIYHLNESLRICPTYVLHRTTAASGRRIRIEATMLSQQKFVVPAPSASINAPSSERSDNVESPRNANIFFITFDSTWLRDCHIAGSAFHWYPSSSPSSLSSCSNQTT